MRAPTQNVLNWCSFTCTSSSALHADLPPVPHPTAPRIMTVLVSVSRRAVAVRNVISNGCTIPAAAAAAVGREASSTALPTLVCCPRRLLSTASPRGPRRAEGNRRNCWLPSPGREVAAQLGGASRQSSSSSSSDSGGLAKPLLKPMRSVLYTPGSSRHLYKIREIACDASLIDLEVGARFVPCRPLPSCVRRVCWLLDRFWSLKLLPTTAAVGLALPAHG